MQMIGNTRGATRPPKMLQSKFLNVFGGEKIKEEEEEKR
jgi:hypothetical protein